MIDNDTSSIGVEELIAWHKERASWYEADWTKHVSADVALALYKYKCRHMTTAELLEELQEWRGDEITDDSD